jgi:acetylornithine deacetylase
MKGSIACMLMASQRVAWDDLKRPIYFCITADEEVGFHGAKCVVEESKLFREMVDTGTKAIIGEPTSLEIVHAHKGSVILNARARGVEAHSSTRAGANANLKMIPFLTEMKAIHDETESDVKWHNEMFDPPTLSWNIKMHDNNPALNVKASRSFCSVYFRPMPGINHEVLIDRAKNVAEENEIKLKVERQGEPFFADPSSSYVQEMLKLCHKHKPKTVSFGTDGGVFSEIEDKVICGPGSIEQAHTKNEWISLEQLSQGTELYTKMIRHWCCES